MHAYLLCRYRGEYSKGVLWSAFVDLKSALRDVTERVNKQQILKDNLEGRQFLLRSFTICSVSV